MAGREFDVTDAIALLLQLGRDAGLELIDVGARHEADLEFGLGGVLCLRGSYSARADEQDAETKFDSTVFLNIS
jgi:hypothetical protein